MLLTAVLRTRLLGAIETDSLIFLCGAGLSMASPTSLPSAMRVAQMCYDKWTPIEALEPAFREDIDKLAGYFYARGDFNVFIRIVPWNELVGQPNRGHAAISDLLISRAAHAAMSSNFDPMIELWAEERKVAMLGALTGQEAVTFHSVSNPLLKFHGCMQRAREQTLWTQGQLTEATAQARVKSCTDWMNLNLPGKHIVIVGFWTDWGYLNDVLSTALAIDNAASVTVVDPCSTACLQSKAPELWTKLNTMSHSFEHVRASGADFLEELRTEYSKTWVRKFYAFGAPLANAAGTPIAATANPDGLSCNDLYDLRRDAQGVPYTRAATLKAPTVDSAQAAFVHLKLLNAGAVKHGPWLEHAGRSIRVVNGAGQGLEEVKSRFKEPATMTQADFIVCAGALKLGVPAKLIPVGRSASVLRPAGGIGSEWLTHDEAEAALGI